MKPRGGSSLLNEVDGNVGCWREGNVTYFYSDENKFRGGRFEISFRKALVELQDVVDTKGRRIPVPVFSIPTAEAELECHLVERNKDDRLLMSILAYPHWNQAGHSKSLNLPAYAITRTIKKLREQKLVKETSLELTKSGKERAEASAKMGLQ